jgi:hypothetical protein
MFDRIRQSIGRIRIPLEGDDSVVLGWDEAKDMG